jgi:hypothetical protein
MTKLVAEYVAIYRELLVRTGRRGVSARTSRRGA